MELQLQYNSNLSSPAFAALLQGGNTAAWLKQLSSWDLNPEDISCYLLPESAGSLKPSALFVVFHNPAQIKNLDLLCPYTRIGKHLYIPCNATLFPRATEAELDKLLLWPIQVFHPSIGLVGFEESSRLDMASLFRYPELKDTSWNFADPGLADRPLLQQITVMPVAAETIMDEIKTGIGQKPIEDIIPADEKNSPVIDNLLNTLKLLLLLPIFGLLKLAEFFLRPLGGNGNESSSREPGLLQQLQNWIAENMDELQKKRDKELKRLSDLFDTDTDEALRYALPLNSPYLDRGKSAPASSMLGRRSTSFNLGVLGGGRSVDAWNVDNYYNDLRTKYLRAAEKEIAQKDFKKAAYVYAHLLGDYYNAAKVLEQGKFYRESAALYKDHLKNIPAAAECLERGGFYTEAIDLYIQLSNDEKAGDLYLQIQQEKKAQHYYESCMNKKVEANNLLDAARVAQQKMKQEEKARELLLQGWNSNYQHEACLKKYFDSIMEKDDADIESAITRVYKEHTPERKQLSLLNVLEHVNASAGNAAVLQHNQDIAYEILHHETVKGNLVNLHSLKKFLPGNKLIGSDTSRFVSNSTRRLAGNSITDMQLDSSIKWKRTTWHKNQFIAAGIKNKQLHMARANWYGNIEYYSWETETPDHTSLYFIDAPYYSQNIILQSSSKVPYARKVLPSNKYFSESLVVKPLVWMHAHPPLFLVNQAGNIARLEINGKDITLQEFTMEGVLLKAVNCELVSGTFGIGSNYHGRSLFFNDGYYYTYSIMAFLSISATGGIKAFDLQTGIRMIAASDQGSSFFIVISTNKGCCLCEPFKGELNFSGDYFAEALIPRQIVFISSQVFVLAEKMKLAVYEIVNKKPLLVYEQQTSTAIAGILPVPKRNSFAIVEEGGRISLHDINKTGS